MDTIFLCFYGVKFLFLWQLKNAEISTTFHRVAAHYLFFMSDQNSFDYQPTPPIVSRTSIVAQTADAIRHELAKVIVGQDELISLLLTALFCEGHVLIEGVPGIAKTLTAKLLAKSVKAQFSRIQFTPDLMPTDVIGTMVYNMQTAQFTFNAGPVFANLVLIDEINRAPAKTQSALFEVMEERQVTIDGVTRQMSFPFFVLATQNPIEQEGTYRLPEAQLDRFLFKINVEYPSLSEEQQILYRFKEDFRQTQQADVQTIVTPEVLRECQQVIEKVQIRKELLDYIAQIVHQTRTDGDLFLGASPRASLAILKTAKAMAAIAERDFVIPEDIQAVAYPVLNHRIILTPEREMEGYTSREVIANIVKGIDVPR
jgi:MoxR-like ATPase